MPRATVKPMPVSKPIARAILEILLLGTFRLSRNGEKISIPRRKAMALLAYLVVTGQPHSRETLMTLLWPEEEPALARSNLRRILSELSTILGKDVLSIQRDQVGLNLQTEIYVDVIDFKQKVSSARQHQHDSKVGCQDCLDNLVKATELYSGDFLAGFSLPDSRTFDEWQFFEAESLHELLSTCLQTLSEWYMNKGEPDRAIEYARRYLSLDPLHEPAHRLLMRLYALAGRQSSALRQYEECVQLLRKELKSKPEQETIELYEIIRSRQISPVVRQAQSLSGLSSSLPDEYPSGKPLNNIARPSTSLVGRKAELSRIMDLFAQQTTSRLVTLTGPGGSGKTRLALETAARLADDPTSYFQHGIWFVSLAPLTAARGIPDKIAQTLNLPLPEGSQQTRLMLLDFLKPKHMVLVLDNFEHLTGEESTSLVIDILAAAPNVKILVTSRERLHVHDEQIILLAGLQMPSDLSHTSDEAIQMFRQCAARLKPGHEITVEDLPAIAHICRLVEGMPLGIELAAAWLDALSPVEIAAEIERSLDFLESDWRDLPERQHSLRAVFESSWSLLSEPERQVLVALAVFQGGLTRQAAESTTGVSLKMLLALIHKSWISQAESGRYFIHELLRQYLSEKLQSNPGSYQSLMENYSSYYAGFMNKQAATMRGPRQLEAFNVIAMEYENILLAWEWSTTHKQVPMAMELMLPALFYFCAVRNKGLEFYRMVECVSHDYQASEQAQTDPGTLAKLLTAQVAINYLGFPNYPDIVAAPQFILDPLNKAWSLGGTDEFLERLGFWGTELSYLYGHIVHFETGIDTLQRLYARFRDHNLQWEAAFTLSFLGKLVERSEPNKGTEDKLFDLGQQSLLDAANLFSQLGDMLQCGYALGMLGDLGCCWSDEKKMINYWLEAREKLQQGGDRIIAVHMLVQIGEAYIAACEFELGFQFFQSAANELLEMGYVNEAAIVFSKEALYASRYSSLEHARRVREQSIELSYQQNDKFGLSWHYWEMGELLRLAGDTTSARDWYARALPLIEMDANPLAIIFYLRGLGDLAQMEGSYEEASHYFQESLLKAEQVSHDWAIGYALAGLGRAEISLGRFITAGDYFKKGYMIAKKSGNIDMMLVVLAGLAGLCAVTGERAKAAYLARLVINEGQSWKETKAQAKKILDSLEVEIPDNEEIELACSSGIGELNEKVSRIEAQFTSQWQVNCA